MAWPNTTIDTTHFDEATDDASQARAEIEQMANNVNDMQAARGAVDGIASLDSGGKVPPGELPVIPASQGGTSQQAYTVGDILYANATNTLTKLPAGTLGYVLKSNGPGAAPSWQQEGGGLTSGTRMIFQNTAAPTGWTKETNSAFNDAALRIVTGTVGSGGSAEFSSVFGGSTLGHALTIAQMPAHSHPYTTYNGISPPRSQGNYSIEGGYNGSASGTKGAASQGGDEAHSHGIPEIKYRDFILAQKD